MNLSNIIASAIELRDNLAAKQAQPTYLDYEYYKNLLHDNGLFGYESKIADILGV